MPAVKQEKQFLQSREMQKQEVLAIKKACLSVASVLLALQPLSFTSLLAMLVLYLSNFKQQVLLGFV